MLFVGYGEIGSCPIFRVDSFSLTTFQRFLLFGRSWRIAAHTYAHHNHKEEVFGEWYSVFKVQSRFRHTKENRARGFVLSPCSPWESPFLDTIP